MTPSLAALKGCSRPGCEEPHYARGECRKHYAKTSRSKAQNTTHEKPSLVERPGDREGQKRVGKTPSDQDGYKPFRDLSQVVAVGAVVKVSYQHPLAGFTEIIEGRVMDLDFKGAVRIMSKGGRSSFLDRRYIRSTNNRTCVECDKDFHSKRPEAIYCSRRCRDGAKNEQ